MIWYSSWKCLKVKMLPTMVGLQDEFQVWLQFFSQLSIRLRILPSSSHWCRIGVESSRIGCRHINWKVLLTKSKYILIWAPLREFLNTKLLTNLSHANGDIAVFSDLVPKSSSLYRLLNLTAHLNSSECLCQNLDYWTSPETYAFSIWE